MQIVIDIPEKIYDAIMDDQVPSYEEIRVLCMDIVRGTPLPKGHGFIAICDSDYAITEGVINKLKDTVFVGDEECSYCFEMTEIIEST